MMTERDYFPAEQDLVRDATQAVQEGVHQLGNHVAYLQALLEEPGTEMASQLQDTHRLITGLLERLDGVREAQAALLNAVIIELQ
jgi:hypothetical protein